VATGGGRTTAGDGRRTDNGWRRYFQRQQTSFDATRENTSKDNEEYQQKLVTPVDRRPDRDYGAMATRTMTDDAFGAGRWKGCEGTQAGQWEHLVRDDHRGKNRGPLAYLTTLRDQKGDESDSRITDNRSDGCLVEMLGKKKWYNAQSHDPMTAPVSQGGDARLNYLNCVKVLPEPDEDNRRLRIARHRRRDDPIANQSVEVRGNVGASK